MTAQLDGFENFQVLDIIEFNFKLIELRNTPLKLIVVGIPTPLPLLRGVQNGLGEDVLPRGGHLCTMVILQCTRIMIRFSLPIRFKYCRGK